MSLEKLKSKIAEHEENYQNWWGWEEGYTFEDKADFMESAYYTNDSLLTEAVKMLEEFAK